MTDLTEQWKNRKLRLPIGEYYVLHISWCEEITKLYYDGGMFFSGDVPIESNEIKEVLAPVPSYEEWQAKLEENAQLKELLEECSPYIGHSAASRMIKNSAGHKKDMKLLTKIDEALK